MRARISSRVEFTIRRRINYGPVATWPIALKPRRRRRKKGTRRCLTSKNFVADLIYVSFLYLQDIDIAQRTPFENFLEYCWLLASRFKAPLHVRVLEFAFLYWHKQLAYFDTTSLHFKQTVRTKKSPSSVRTALENFWMLTKFDKGKFLKEGAPCLLCY